jgi:hypothetical protein
MAKAATTKIKTDKKKKGGAPETVKIKVAKKEGKKASKKEAGLTKDETKRSKTRDSLDGLARLADHPLVADLLAAGAIAAVAAITEHQVNKGERATSSKMVKSVGKAAAAAMGKKLLGDIGAITSAAADAVKKG